MLASFSNRMTSYFAALLVASLGGLFVLWYFGFAPLGLIGANHQQLDNAIQLLEVKADLQRHMIATELEERRGDALLISQTESIASNIGTEGKNLQANLQLQFANLQRSYGNRFTKLLIVAPESGTILASTGSDEVRTKFDQSKMLAKAREPGFTPMIESWMNQDGSRVLVIIAQINSTVESTVGSAKKGMNPPAALVAILDLKTFFEHGFQSELASMNHHGTTILFDQNGAFLASFPVLDSRENFFTKNRQILDGFEGALQQTNALNHELIVVYRSLRLSAEQTWTMVHYSQKSRILAELDQKINVLLVIGFLITLISLMLISFASRRLTRPLDALSNVAKQLGNGDLNVRASMPRNETKEMHVLSASFNAMASAMQGAQLELEGKVVQRTEALVRSEARHLTLFNATANAVLLLDGKSIIECNPAALALFGADEKRDLLGRRPIDLSPQFQRDGNDSIARTRIEMSRLKEKGSHLFEWVHQRVDTQACFDAEVLLNFVVLDGKKLIQATIRDISERKRTAAALYASEERHRTLVEWSPEGINVHRKHKLIYVNAAAIRMLGAKTADQIIGKPIHEIVHPDCHHVLTTTVREISDGGARDPNYEIKFVKLDGEVIEVTAQGALIEFDGAPAVYVAWHDITERKRNAESQRIAATAFESQEGMFVTDADWKILRVNHSLSKITGFSADELLGRTPSLVNSETKLEVTFEEVKRSIDEFSSWQGEVTDRRKDGVEFPAWVHISSVKDESGITTHYVASFNDITMRKASEDEIRSLAFYDPLTKLPNRRLLMDRLEQALASGMRHHRKGALLFIDLDNFKTLNDTLGHDHGDLLLQQVAERLSRCTREGDTVARLGGDEFVIMLENLEENAFEALSQVEAVAIKILSELNQTYWLGANEHHSSPSIGVTLFGEKMETIAEPLKRADLAMYQAKAAGRNTVRYFDPKMQLMVSQRAALEEDLREAMFNDQFQLHYQAQLTDDGGLFGAEVLLRWIHPTRGMISPVEFIPLAEETGLIVILGYWVLNTAATQLAMWANQEEFEDLSIAVNVSPSQFHHKNFVEQVLDVLELTGANPKRLKLELTEGFSIANIEDVIAKMTRLKAIGVGFSLDDFGTGYSSLSYLKRLPLDQLKIDQSFVRDILIDPNDAAISKMVIVLAESLGLAVIAEGVETKEQQAFLAAQGCHAYQGYLFSKPIPVVEFEAYSKKIVHDRR